MLRDDLKLLKEAWLRQAVERYDTLNEVAREAAVALPLLQEMFTSEMERLKQSSEAPTSSPLPDLQSGLDTPEQRQTQ